MVRWSNMRPKNLDVLCIGICFWLRNSGGRVGIGFRWRNVTTWVFVGENWNPCMEVQWLNRLSVSCRSRWALDGFELLMLILKSSAKIRWVMGKCTWNDISLMAIWKRETLRTDLGGRYFQCFFVWIGVRLILR